jgi:glycosyltransferase involved in cell wall biosynthesis
MSEFIPLISVIIPTYNRAEMLGITIESFVNQQYPHDNYEIIVSDNNSSDNTKEIVSEWQSKSDVRIKYIFEKRQGVHYARNSAAKIARGDILYFTDDDMIADRSLIEEIVKVFDLDPLIGSATGKIIGRFDVTPPRWVTKYLTNAYLSLTAKDKPEDLIVSRNDLVFSCHEAVRRDVFFQCGGFNPENTAGVWIGDGETGLGIKMKQAGYKFAYSSKSVIYHLIPEARTTLGYLIKRIGNQGFCDAYTAYREHRDRKKILPKMATRNTVGLFKMAITTAIKILLGLESWHFILARIAYLYKRNIYDLKLYRDAEFRRLVEIDDWLNNDYTFDAKLG